MTVPVCCWWHRSSFHQRNWCNEAIASPVHGRNVLGRLGRLAQHLPNLPDAPLEDPFGHGHLDHHAEHAVDLQRLLHGGRASLQIAIGAGESFSGYVDLVHRKAWRVEGGKEVEADAVIIATPTHLHRAIVEASPAAGR